MGVSVGDCDDVGTGLNDGSDVVSTENADLSALTKANSSNTRAPGVISRLARVMLGHIFNIYFQSSGNGT